MGAKNKMAHVWAHARAQTSNTFEKENYDNTHLFLLIELWSYSSFFFQIMEALINRTIAPAYVSFASVIAPHYARIIYSIMPDNLLAL